MNYMSEQANKTELGVWEIAVLAMLREEPMHPYQMRRLLKARHKDAMLALKHGSLYHAIRRLEQGGLIAVEATGRDGKRPERTTYRLTAEGERALLGSLRRMVAGPRRESSEFMAGMSFLVHLPPEEAVAQLRERVTALRTEIAALEGGLEAVRGRVARVHLIESEYLGAVLRAELEWVEGLLGDVETGRLGWDFAEVLREAEADREKARGKE